MAFTYGGRIHRGKLTGRSLRYVAADLLAAVVPALRRRWLFPAAAVPVAQAGSVLARIPVEPIAAPYPPLLARIADRDGGAHCHEQIVYEIAGATITGQAGAVMANGRLVALRAAPNWPIALRPRRHAERRAGPGLHLNLVCPVPARGQIFLWLYDYIVPLLAWLETRPAEPPTLIVNAELTKFQAATLDFVVRRYGLPAAVPLGENEALHVPRLAQIAFAPDNIRALRPQAGLAALDALGEALAAPHLQANGETPPRLYISRDDAKLRRVGNEAALMAVLAPLGFTRLTLKGRTPAEQVALFRGAQAVVSAHGAGLTNLSWCQAGTVVVEAFPSPDGPLGAARNASSSYWRVSEQRALRYVPLEAGPRLNRRDLFEISPAAALAALGRAGLA